MSLQNDIQGRLQQLLTTAKQDQWAGWDPFDALSSPLIQRLCFGSKWLRTAWIQAFKRSPWNMRPLFRVPKLKNPKGLALFISTACEQGDLTLAEDLANQLRPLQSPVKEGLAWGYPFDWQSRAFFAPRGTPNVIVSSFCGHALLDLYERTRKQIYLEDASRVCDFILTGLNRTSKGETWCFSYTPLDHSQIHNANLLAASLLARTGSFQGSDDLRSAADRAARFSLAAQREDGSWVYGEAPNQQWVDGFHTGFNLIALQHIFDAGICLEKQEALRKGFSFYLTHFFSPEGAPFYYADRLYPIDVHSAAQAIITLSKLSALSPSAGQLCERVMNWSLSYLWDASQKNFLYQIHPLYKIRIPYLRWSTAWMTRALSTYLNLSEGAQDVTPPIARLSY
jgi:hypothetical protein